MSSSTAKNITNQFLDPERTDPGIPVSLDEEADGLIKSVLKVIDMDLAIKKKTAEAAKKLNIVCTTKQALESK